MIALLVSFAAFGAVELQLTHDSVLLSGEPLLKLKSTDRLNIDPVEKALRALEPQSDEVVIRVAPGASAQTLLRLVYTCRTAGRMKVAVGVVKEEAKLVRLGLPTADEDRRFVGDRTKIKFVRGGIHVEGRYLPHDGLTARIVSLYASGPYADVYDGDLAESAEELVGWLRALDEALVKIKLRVIPEPFAYPSRFDVMGAVDQDIVLGVVKKNAAMIRRCAEKTKPRVDGEAGPISFAVMWKADGTVFSADVQPRSVIEPAVAECMESSAKEWRFPKPRGGGIGGVTFRLDTESIAKFRHE